MQGVISCPPDRLLKYR